MAAVSSTRFCFFSFDVRSCLFQEVIPTKKTPRHSSSQQPAVFGASCRCRNLANKRRVSSIGYVLDSSKQTEAECDHCQGIHGDETSNLTLNCMKEPGGDQNPPSQCPGCGVLMQDNDPDFPGYYRPRKTSKVKPVLCNDNVEDTGDDDDVEYEAVNEDEYPRNDMSKLTFIDGSEIYGCDNEFERIFTSKGEEIDSSMLIHNCNPEIAEEDKVEKRLPKKTRAEKRRTVMAAKGYGDVTVCARCHSLRYYGSIKNEAAEKLIPEFDFDRLVSAKLVEPKSISGSTIIVIVVDCVDFDGSFPEQAIDSLSSILEGRGRKHKMLPTTILVATKIDLLPAKVSHARLHDWVKRRAQVRGMSNLSAIFLVSAHKGWGTKDLLSFINNSVGPRGDVWMVGAQNAGKSTLINKLSKIAGSKVSKLTEAPTPGTTVGITKVFGVFASDVELYDTPGTCHPYLVSTRLIASERKMIEIQKELKPITYRVKAGYTMHVGGLLRIDIDEATVDTIYVSIWASARVPIHLGKKENAEELWRNNIGVRLQPPLSKDRASELGKWVKEEITVTGSNWKLNSSDVSVAGFCWLSLCLKGEAKLTVWTHEGIHIYLREPLVPDRPPTLYRPGFLLPSATLDAISKQETQTVAQSAAEVNCL